ncbi:MAG: hypothetical protein EA341_04795 [Mongoliibacter sp.]|nr:MAG: hypothetical protein EA341_04795 [Mongoliibacter sp.]
MQPVKIAIASVLKPLKDSRSYYKFGLSLRETNKYQINIIGFCSKKERDEKSIKFHPLFYKNRNSISRFAAGFRLLKLLIKIKPKILIVTTYELLPYALLGKFLLKYKVIYDIQENYSLNIKYNNGKYGIEKSFFAGIVKLIESSSRPFIDHFIFAEKCYPNEFHAIKNFTIFENKYQGPITQGSKPFKIEADAIQFLLCGTLAEVYGGIDAILWFENILKINPYARLKILGHAPLEGFRNKLRDLVRDKPYIHACIEDKPLDYTLILEAYKAADLILLPYHQIKSISPKIPSKLYECLALNKAFLFSPNTAWKSLAEKYGAGIEVDFQNPNDHQSVLQFIKSKVFYDKFTAQEALWETEKEKFLDLIDNHITST